MTKVLIKTADRGSFEPEEEVALKSITIQDARSAIGRLNLPEDEDYEICIRASSRSYAKVIEYCKKHVETPGSDLRSWDAEFVKVDPPTLVDLLKAADHLQIQDLKDLIADTIIGMIEGMSAAEFRFNFDIQDDFA